MLQQSNHALLAASGFHEGLASNIPSYWQTIEWGPSYRNMIAGPSGFSLERCLCILELLQKFISADTPFLPTSVQIAWRFVFARATGRLFS